MTAVPNRPLEQIKDDIVLGVLRLDDAIIELADEDRAQDIAVVLSARASVATDAALQLLNGATEQPAALLCRASGLSLNGYSAVLRMRRRVCKVEFGGPSALLQAYQGLAPLTGGELIREIETSLAEIQS